MLRAPLVTACLVTRHSLVVRGISAPESEHVLSIQSRLFRRSPLKICLPCPSRHFTSKFDSPQGGTKGRLVKSRGDYGKGLRFPYVYINYVLDPLNLITPQAIAPCVSMVYIYIYIYIYTHTYIHRERERDRERER